MVERMQAKHGQPNHQGLLRDPASLHPWPKLVLSGSIGVTSIAKHDRATVEPLTHQLNLAAKRHVATELDHKIRSVGHR